MGFRFSRRVSILPGLKLNLSGSGVSLSAGVRGAHINLGPRGLYGSAGIPGTGLSYRQRLDSASRSYDRPSVERRLSTRQWGAFYGTELDLELRRRGMTAIILCGISTNIGVESTARFAYEYGYNQVFAEDAMAALSAEEHALTVTKIFPRIGLVRKTEEILVDLSHD